MQAKLLMANMLTVNGEPGPVGVVGAKVVGHHALVTSLIGEVDIEEVQHCGVDQLAFLVAGVVLYLGTVKHLAVLPPRCAHWRVAAAQRHAAQGHVVAAQDHRCLGMSGDPRLGEVVYWVKRITSIHELHLDYLV